LCKSDGFKVFGCRRFGLRLVPDWPLTTRQELLAKSPAPRRVGGDVRGDEAALIACAWGRPSDAFGALYQKFDGAARAPRLPGPPYHFLTRVVSVEGAPGAPQLGASVITEYDIPEDAWYLAEAGGMPLAVLTEVLLQPCGWLASYFGFAANRASDVLFRNLDGEGATLHRAVTPGSGRLKVTARLERFAQAAGSTIVFFTVVCEDAAGPVMSLKTDFGFFEPKALESQAGLPAPPEMRARLAEPSAHGAVDLSAAMAPLRSLDRLRMLDEITGYWPGGGAASPMDGRSAPGGGESGARLRARQKVEPGAWYFKAHFYQDPVQPGSLGLEALVELAQVLLLLERPGLRGCAFEPVAVAEPFSWRFRGQVTPASREVVTEIEALEILDEPGGSLIRGCGSLWVDGLRIYEMPVFAVRARCAP
jgi:3-hydroxymyristoyl/3-hydroxydecanoyl-(acyl carrier protein) dehydratase